MKIAKYLIATIVGLVAGGVTVFAIESINTLIYPLPDGVTMSNREALAQFVATMPIGGFVMVLLAWLIGNLVAGFLARRLAPGRSLVPPLITCGLLLVGAILNLFMIPHPAWFWFAGIAASLGGAFIGITLARPKASMAQAY
jgi:hypothetical protein